MSQHLASRPAVLAACPACGAQVIAATAAGFAVAADPRPLTIHAEIAARLQGRETFDVIPWDMRLFLEYRGLHRITLARSHAVIAAHPCHVTISTARLKPLTTITRAPESEVIPF